MDVLVYSLAPLSKLEGVGNVALNVAERLPFSCSFYNPGKHRKLLFYSFLSPLAFALAVRRLKPRVVLAHTTEASFDPIIAKKIFRFNYKVVCVAHGLYPDLAEEYFKEVRLGNAKKRFSFIANLKISSFRSRFVSGADKIIAVSEMVKRSLKERYGVDSVVIPNGIDSSEFAGARRTRKSKGNILLFAGNQFWLKGLHYLIRANALLKKPWEIVAVGMDSSQEEEIKVLVDCKGVVFKGKVSRQNLMKEYKKANAFAMPSVYESFGMVYLEALAFGLPVLASKGTGAEDIIENGVNGFLVEKRNVKSLASALEALRKLNLKRFFPDKKFLWANISAKYAEVLVSVGLNKKKIEAVL